MCMVMQGKFKTQFECATQSLTPAGAWYLEKSLLQASNTWTNCVARYVHIILLTDPAKEFHEHLQWGAEALKENVTTTTAKLNMITQQRIFG